MTIPELGRYGMYEVMIGNELLSPGINYRDGY